MQLAPIAGKPSSPAAANNIAINASTLLNALVPLLPKNDARKKENRSVPIKPENKDRYPADWKHIVERIRERSRDACEGSPAYPDCRAKNGEPHPVTGSIVVLTTAHLDHTPENCDPKNLRHWCQRCHLTYDAKHHSQSAYMTRRAGKALDWIKGLAGEK